MMRVRHFCIAALLVFTAGAAHAEDVCKLEALGTVQPVSVREGATLMLADGRELRLAAIEPWANAATVSALRMLAVGQVLTLKGSAATDRYGRVVAYATLPAGRTVQEALLAQGLARVATRTGGIACAAGLLKAEAAARAAKSGLWADPNFALLPAESSIRISAEAGKFAVVEGKVLSVRESGGTIYMNFGRRWSRDFSITISRRNKRMFTAAGIDPATLAGRRVRVRGWIEQRRGPIIEAAHPEQIEIVE